MDVALLEELKNGEMEGTKKLQVDDIASAVIYLLGTPVHVQVKTSFVSSTKEY